MTYMHTLVGNSICWGVMHSQRLLDIHEGNGVPSRNDVNAQALKQVHVHVHVGTCGHVKQALKQLLVWRLSNIKLCYVHTMRPWVASSETHNATVKKMFMCISIVITRVSTLGVSIGWLPGDRGSCAQRQGSCSKRTEVTQHTAVLLCSH